MYDSRNDGNSLLGFSSLSEIDVQAYNSNEKDRDRAPPSSFLTKPSLLQQLNISEIKGSRQSMSITASPNRPSQFYRNETKYPSIVSEESQSIMKPDFNKTSRSSQRGDAIVQTRSKEAFFENAFLIGLAELMKRQQAK